MRTVAIKSKLIRVHTSQLTKQDRLCVDLINQPACKQKGEWGGKKPPYGWAEKVFWGRRGLRRWKPFCIFGNIYRRLVSKRREGRVGVWESRGQEALSARMEAQECFSLSRQVGSKTYNRMFYVFNVAGIGSITVNLESTTNATRHNQRPRLSVCVCGWVCGNSLIKYLWPNHGSYISPETRRQSGRVTGKYIQTGVNFLHPQTQPNTH